MQNNYFKLSVFIEKEEEGYYAYCSELMGCHSHGGTYEEIKQNMQEAVDIYLESFTEHEAIDYLGKTHVHETSNLKFNIQLRLSVAQAEKLLLKAGFSLVASKNNHRIYIKKNSRFVLPLQAGKVLSKRMAQEILDLVDTK